MKSCFIITVFNIIIVNQTAIHRLHANPHLLPKDMYIETGNNAVDEFFKGNIQLINNFMMALAEEQIKAAFEQSEKEVTDLHRRISQGIREAKKNGAQIGLSKDCMLTTKKSLQCKAIIKKHSKDFGGSLEDSDVIKLCSCSRNSYYKYKGELKEQNEAF